MIKIEGNTIFVSSGLKVSEDYWSSEDLIGISLELKNEDNLLEKAEELFSKLDKAIRRRAALKMKKGLINYYNKKEVYE